MSLLDFFENRLDHTSLPAFFFNPSLACGAVVNRTPSYSGEKQAYFANMAAAGGKAGAGAGAGGGVSAENVKVCVRVRPISGGPAESAWTIPEDAPHQIQLMDVKGKLNTTYGVGAYPKST